MRPETIYSLFLEAARRWPGRTALLDSAVRHGRRFEFRRLVTLVEQTAELLRGCGIGKGDTVGIMSANRPEWVLADLATLKLGGVVVPIYPTLPIGVVKYIVNDARLKVLFAEGAELTGQLELIRGRSPTLQEVIPIEQLLADAAPNAAQVDGHLQSCCDAAAPDDTATVVYTSGTTGTPKGVVLTHRNLVSNALAISRRFQVAPRDVSLSYLPLCHMFERTCGYYALLLAGGCIAYAESTYTVADDVKRVRPTILLAVPRVVEKAYDIAVKRVEAGSPLKRVLVAAAMRALNSRANLRYRGQRVPFHLRVQCALYDAAVARPLRRIGGGRLRVVACGGAPLDRKIAKAFYILGFNIVEGYGLTEASPIVCCSTVLGNRLGTVGKPLEGVDVRIGEADEVLVRGSGVMRGYLNRPEETAATIDEQGWLHTGDRGRLDEDGNLTITGRIKDLFVTSYGKNVAPAPIEALLTRSRYISQAVLFGDRRKYMVALIVPDRQAVELFAQQTGLGPDDYPALLKDERVRSLIGSELNLVAPELPSYERAKYFALLPEEFSVENGLLTPTLKLRRQAIYDRYREEIEKLYLQGD